MRYFSGLRQCPLYRQQDCDTVLRLSLQRSGTSALGRNESRHQFIGVLTSGLQKNPSVSMMVVAMHVLPFQFQLLSLLAPSCLAAENPECFDIPIPTYSAYAGNWTSVVVVVGQTQLSIIIDV